MAMQAYLVHCTEGTVGTLKSIATQIRSLNGLILMATRQGVLIAAFDDAQVERVRKIGGVTFVGGVTLDPRGQAARELNAVFATHIARQLG